MSAFFYFKSISKQLLNQFYKILVFYNLQAVLLFITGTCSLIFVVGCVEVERRRESY
jgi:hypothetical protein